MSEKEPLELWGGLEATIVRIGDRFRDQIAETGHRDRIEDLDRIAALGIRTLRYPILWEAIAPERPDETRWDWHDARAERLRALGVRPIAGLIHHGSGPAYTSLVDPAFPELFAVHARNVAERYPWIDLYTPVNEPLTTARFSGLYGHWYPHERSDRAFLRALVNECRATLLAMREIRRVNPGAKLVQTEDFGKTFSTPALAYQAELENERRWLSFDLLFGRVDRHHPWWPVLVENGIEERELDELAEGAGAPDIVGINHYLTSERFLDERVTRYPEHFRGGNGQDSYADVEAVRIRSLVDEVGPASRLREVWERYHAPIAITEAHHGCSRDEQLRWLVEVWQAARTVRSEGADIRAVTIWSLFGAVDWNSLLTREAGFYEPGPFDVRGPCPRATALAAAASSLASHGEYDHPVLDSPGWWRRETRFYTPGPVSVPSAANAPRRVVILGDGGPVAEAISRIATERGLAHAVLGPRDQKQLDGTFAPSAPWALIDLTGLSRHRSAIGEAVPDLAWRAHLSGARFVTLTGPGLFSGRLGRPYAESDPPDAADAPGRRALAREQQIRRLNPQALAVRTGPLFGPWDRENDVFELMLSLAAGGQAAKGSEVVSPSYLPDLAHALLDLLVDGESGIWHLANCGEARWDDIAERLASRAGLEAARQTAAKGMRNLALATEHGAVMPSLDSALDRFLHDCEPDWRMADGRLRVAAE
jgi:dTDP-4-dehydrorhamnose reductase